MNVIIERVILCAGSALAALPLFLVLAYLTLGRYRRASQLKSYVRRASGTAEQGGGEGAIGQGANPFASYLERRYFATHNIGSYLTALGVFYVVYGVLLYWTFYAWGVELSRNPATADKSAPIWALVRVGAVGAMGATLSAIWHLHWRVIRLDLQPRTLLHLSARLCVSPFVAVALSVFLPAEGAYRFTIAFAAGLLGEEALRRLIWVSRQAIHSVKNSDESLPLQMIQGIGAEDELRLWEEGITDAQHLAVETVENLLTNTNYSLERILDWKDQAFLYTHVGPDIVKWRALHTRSALDVLGMAAVHYGEERHKALLASLSNTLGKDVAVLDRLIDTVFSDPQVNQLWSYVVTAYPSVGTAAAAARTPEAGGMRSFQGHD